MVWEVLSAAGDHLTAPSITSRVHAVDPSINGASVYRALTLFAELGLVRESRYEDASTWEPFHDDAAIHLVCSECGQVMHHNTELVRACGVPSKSPPTSLPTRSTCACQGVAVTAQRSRRPELGSRRRRLPCGTQAAIDVVRHGRQPLVEAAAAVTEPKAVGERRSDLGPVDR